MGRRRPAEPGHRPDRLRPSRDSTVAGAGARSLETGARVAADLAPRPALHA
ncbi:hypothetical protein ABZ330_13930 [Streptomyces sp. NPDC006172]|uniref:hypothetical protein n=1 Tax=Streptomyces sp. NPDC006172 TaxID=3154470 RepID=UPI0033E2AF23